MINKFPICEAHKKISNYYCKDDDCFKKPLACGDCLFDLHFKHMKKVLRIQDIANNINNNF